jgi:hypothetical protein
MQYLLDANAVIALPNDSTSQIAGGIRRYAPRDCGVPAVVIHELSYGAFQEPACRAECCAGWMDFSAPCWNSIRRTPGTWERGLESERHTGELWLSLMKIHPRGAER